MDEKLKIVKEKKLFLRGCPSWSKGADSRREGTSAGEGLRGFKAHPPHHIFLSTKDVRVDLTPLTDLMFSII